MLAILVGGGDRIDFPLKVANENEFVTGDKKRGDKGQRMSKYTHEYVK